ncbi:MAG: HAMP domain-containing sensor histidine kinase [Candidatus Zixiibacteriota bacterium]
MAWSGRILPRTSDLYIGKSTYLKVFLLIGVIVISTMFIWYTFAVIRQLQHDTRDQVEKYVKLWQLAANSPTSGNELQFIFNEIIVKATFPIIVTDSMHEPLYWRNLAGISPEDTTATSHALLRLKAASMHGHNGEYPLYFAGKHVNYFLYGDSEVINQLRIMPFIQIGIVLAFMVVGIIGFQTIRRSEERHIWVGMAKETAHQLGTPLSSLMGWIEMIEGECAERGSASANQQLGSIVDNMKVDIARLQRVTNRFGQIGSTPELRMSDANELVQEVADYYRRRLPFQGKGIQIRFNPGEIPTVPLNPELFTWALENLTKNAIEAVDSKTGAIDLRTTPSGDGRHIEVEVKDSGKGITPAAARKIFQPGFTTKKRGWGLGLTLVRRIIVEYHGGRIWLDKSQPGETIFRLALPLEQANRRVKNGDNSRSEENPVGR